MTQRRATSDTALLYVPRLPVLSIVTVNVREQTNYLGFALFRCGVFVLFEHARAFVHIPSSTVLALCNCGLSVEGSLSDRGPPTTKMACACVGVVLPVSFSKDSTLLLLGEHSIHANQSQHQFTIPFVFRFVLCRRKIRLTRLENNGLIDTPVEQVVTGGFSIKVITISSKCRPFPDKRIAVQDPKNSSPQWQTDTAKEIL